MTLLFHTIPIQSILVISIFCVMVGFTFSQEIVQKPSSEMYLIRYGYMELPKNVNISSMGRSMVLNPTQVRNAIITFQKRNRLNVTGKMDASTKKKLSSPRCGVSDIHGRSMFGSWPKKNLKYKFIGQLTPDLPQYTVRQAIKEAFDYWAKETPLRFLEVFDRETAEFNMEFLRWDHGDGYPFDGRDGTLAHAFFPTDGRLHFDDDEMFTEGENRGYNLRIVAAHEIGHALGLPHSNDPDALMAPYYAGYTAKDKPLLNYDDITNIQAIYGKPLPETSSTKVMSTDSTARFTAPVTPSIETSTVEITTIATALESTSSTTTSEPTTTTLKPSSTTTTPEPTTTTPEPTTTTPEPTSTTTTPEPTTTTTEPTSTTTTPEPTTTTPEPTSTTTTPEPTTTTPEPTSTTTTPEPTTTTTTIEPTTEPTTETTEEVTTTAISTSFWTLPPQWPMPIPGPDEPDLCSPKSTIAAALMSKDAFLYLIIHHKEKQLLYQTEMTSSLVSDKWPIKFQRYFKQDIPFVNAALFVMAVKTFYFFSGTKMYQYSEFGYYRKEEDIGKEITSAFNLRDGRSIVVTKDIVAWTFNAYKNTFDSLGSLSTLLSGIPSDIDAAAEDYPWSQDMKYVFFFKGRKYYKYDLVKNKVVNGERDIGDSFFGCRQYEVPKF